MRQVSRYASRRRVALASGWLIAVAVLAAPAQAQQSGLSQPSRFSLPLSVHVGLPQGEFAHNVVAAAGFGIGGLFALAPEFGLRGEYDYSLYGSHTRSVPVGGGGFGFSVNVTTTNSINGGAIGAQLGMPGPRTRPYIGALIGLSHFRTSSRIAGRDGNDEPYDAKVHASDNTLAKSVFGGVYYPFGGGTAVFDIGAKYTWNGESVRYLTRGDITEAQNGNLILNIRESRADLLTVRIGVTLRMSIDRGELTAAR